MAFGDSGRKTDGIRLYNAEVKEYLKEKDGKQHVIFINSFSKLFNKQFGVENKVTLQIDEIISLMQEDDYEIIDVQFTTIKNQGHGKYTNEGYQTLIRYK
ncbi:hypothetical protein [Salinicoccus roseus]|uniref:hypothetical protein n=1 Tax=Salinicoccus roseus TaxID=45670 RepID=UPI001EF546F2|nr:hypothetical protein [Salinicoccus roseus]MCG7331220.1 hypothetical protein [Salinicoccus roseus]